MKAMVNLTPHVVRFNGGREIPPSGAVARVATTYMEVEEGIFTSSFGAVVGLPAPKSGTIYIVSGVVAAALPGRPDVYAPATGHPACVRKDGQVWSVPGLVKGA